MVRKAAAPGWWRAHGRVLAVVWLACAAATPAFAQDSDGDGILDVEEELGDSDGDGDPDVIDDDDDNDGFPTIDEDWDGSGDWFDDDNGGVEGIPDYRDRYSPLDDDGDDYIDALHGGDDCNDDSGDYNPGIEFDQFYDGQDVNCDGLSDFDKDGDGYETVLEGHGEDCADEDPDAYPGAPEDPGGDDLDCDGYADAKNALIPNGGCDCGTSAPPPFAALPLLALLASSVPPRRRR